MARKYELRERARSQEQTRQRIVHATVGLHGSVGPARTTISAIAERAGVQRLTVYRHFPDERSLYQACGGQWRADHPAPDPALWEAVAEPAERMRLALGQLYAHFRATEDMTANIRRDLPELPVLQEVIAPQSSTGLRSGWCSRAAGSCAAGGGRGCVRSSGTPSSSRPGARSRAPRGSATTRRRS